MTDEQTPPTGPPRTDLRPAERPLEERRRRLRELFDRVVGPGAQQFYRDGCRLVNGDIVLETGANVLAHCTREIESAVREVLRAVLLDKPGEPPHDCGFDEPETEAHREEIKRLVAALRIDSAIAADLTQSWIWLATGRGRGRRRKGPHARAHRRGQERAAPLNDDDRASWRDLEGVMSEVLRRLEEQFSLLLPLFTGLARRTSPTGNDLSRFLALPNTYTTRRHFFENATPGWLPLLNRARVFEQTEDAFALDATTEELLPQHWTAGEYLARVGTLPDGQAEFVSIVSRIAIPHERAALDLVKAARVLPPALAAPLADRFAKWVSEQPRIVFISRELAELAAHVGGDPAGHAPAARLLAALLALAPDPRAAEREAP